MSCGGRVAQFGSLGISEMTKEDPQDLFGQGLARADNYRGSTAAQEYGGLVTAYIDMMPKVLAAEQEYSPEYIDLRLENMKQAREGMLLADPENAQILDELTQSAMEELQLDNQLDPNQIRLLEQSERAGAADRGLGYGPSEVMSEAFAKSGYGEQLRDKRRGNAMNVKALRDALMAQAGGFAQYAQPNLITNDMTGGWLNNVYGQNQENNRQTSRNETELALKFVDTMSSLGGGALSGI